MTRFVISYTIVLLVSTLCIHNVVALEISLAKQLTAIEKLVDKNEAIAQLNQLKKSQLLSPKEFASVLFLLGRTYHALGDLTGALKSFQKVQHFAQEQHFIQVEADAAKYVGIFHYFKGENQQALVAYQTSLTYYRSENTPIKHANLLNNVGLVYAAMGDTQQALTRYKQAEVIYQKLGSTVDKVDIRYNIAGLYLRLQRYDIAIDLFQQVIKKRIELKDKVGLANVHGDIGIAYKHSGQFPLALKYLLKALSFYQNSNDQYNSASQLHNLAELYNVLNQPENAIEYAQKSIKLSEESGHQNAYAGGLYSLAKAHFYLGDIEQAHEYLQRSNKAATDMNYQHQINDNLALFSLVYAAQNKTQQAIKVHRRYAMQNSIRANKALNVELARFEAEQLKQQVEYLQQNKNMQQLKQAQEQQQQNFVIVATLLSFVLLFFISRRNIERRLKLELENKVEERTHTLVMLTDELVKANAVKSQFLANMSHEIRTPLTSVIGQAEAIINGDVDEAYLHKEVEIIHGNSLHLLDLINNILDLSKVEANKLELDLKKQDLYVILHELMNMFTEQAKAKGLTFEIVHALPTPFYINIDAMRLKQILINLCSNAIKFTTRGHVELTISTEKDTLLFKITDSGIGMSETQLQQVFESFTQGDSSISRRFGGSGLGLCLSDQLAKLMGGKIAVESTLNYGSVFSLILPCLHNVDQYSPISTISVIDGENNEVVNTLSGTILLADDHDDNRRLIARLLKNLGLEVFTAINGKEAVDVFLEQQPQLILLDIQMPEMDGLEAFKVLKQKGCTAPIIALTANAMAHEVEQYLSLGFDGHLKKPIERTLFIATIAKYYGAIDSIDETEKSLANIDMSDLVAQFKSNLVLEQQDLLLLLKNNDLEKLSQLAHRIAGAAQMFGFSLLSEKSIKLESIIKANEVEQVNDIAQRMLNEIDQVLW